MYTVWHTYSDPSGDQVFKRALLSLNLEARAEALALIKKHRLLSARFPDTGADDCDLDDGPIDGDPDLRVLRGSVDSRTCGVIYAYLPQEDPEVRSVVALCVYLGTSRSVPYRFKFIARRRLRSWIAQW